MLAWLAIAAQVAVSMQVPGTASTAHEAPPSSKRTWPVEPLEPVLDDALEDDDVDDAVDALWPLDEDAVEEAPLPLEPEVPLVAVLPDDDAPLDALVEPLLEPALDSVTSAAPHAAHTRKTAHHALRMARIVGQVVRFVGARRNAAGNNPSTDGHPPR